jgi:hypothetical protein
MKDINKGFATPWIIIVVALLVIGSGVFFYKVSNSGSESVKANSLKEVACDDSNKTEIVMNKGMEIIVNTEKGVLNISAGPCYERTYILNKIACTILQKSRTERWNGSLGIYSPSAEDWKPENCTGLVHSVVEEGQQHFASLSEVNAWILDPVMSNYFKSIYTNDGLLISWRLTPLDKSQFLAVNVWQIYINGEKPTKLNGAQDDKIKIISSEKN